MTASRARKEAAFEIASLVSAYLWRGEAHSIYAQDVVGPRAVGVAVRLLLGRPGNVEQSEQKIRKTSSSIIRRSASSIAGPERSGQGLASAGEAAEVEETAEAVIDEDVAARNS